MGMNKMTEAVQARFTMTRQVFSLPVQCFLQMIRGVARLVSPNWEVTVIPHYNTLHFIVIS